VISSAGLSFPIGVDMEREVYAAYSLDALPVFMLLRPGGEILFTTSEPRAYREIEAAIQALLKDLNPEIIHPFLLEPRDPTDDPDAEVIPTTPMLVLGHESGAIADIDSAGFGKYTVYSDRGGREKGKAYLKGRWKVDEHSISHEQESEDAQDHIRVIYAGKEVWLLPAFERDRAPRIYVKQDRKYLPQEIWGKDIHVDHNRKPYVRMRYPLPVQIVSNPRYGAHELQLIIGEGEGALCYIFFKGALAK
jgi:hypothetical protein